MGGNQAWHLGATLSCAQSSAGDITPSSPLRPRRGVIRLPVPKPIEADRHGIDLALTVVFGNDESLSKRGFRARRDL